MSPIKAMSEILIGIISSALAVFITNPLSILRNKMIVVEEEAKYTYTNGNRQKWYDVIKALAMNGRGLRNFEAGLMPALSYYTVTNGIRLGFFSSMEERGVMKKRGNDGLSFANSVAVATGLFPKPLKPTPNKLFTKLQTFKISKGLGVDEYTTITIQIS